MSDGNKAWAEEQEEYRGIKELHDFEVKLNCPEKRLDVLQLLKLARERVSKLRGLDVRLTRFEHSLLDDAIKALNKILD